MNKTISIFTTLVWVVIATTVVAQPAYLHEGPILLKNISVIDGLSPTVLPMRDILITEGRIAKITVTTMLGDLPDNTKVIHGNDLTVMPGLIDAHTHIAPVVFSESNLDRKNLVELRRYLFAHLYAGVTTILELGGTDDLSIQLRDEINSGEQLGPTIHTVGSTINALKSTQDGVNDLTKPEGRAEITEILDRKQALGIDIIKLYTGITPWEARHIMQEAKKRGMRGIADFWCTNLSRTVFEVTMIDSYAHGGCRKMTQEEARWMAANDKFAMVTLSLFDTMGGHRAFADYPKRGYLKNPLIVDVLGKKRIESYYQNFQQLRESFEEGEHSLYNSQLFPDITTLLSDNLHNARLMWEEGVTLAMGTDAAFPPGTWPGEAMHFELAMHVEAGIPPTEAIKMATYNNALLLRREKDIGSIEKGKIADLLVVEGNPGEDINDTRNIHYVIKRGKIVDRNSLRH